MKGEMARRGARAMLVGAATAFTGVLSACGTNPQVLSLNYAIVHESDERAFLDRLNSGAETVDSRLAMVSNNGPCNFTANFELQPGVLVPDMDVSTNPLDQIILITVTSSLVRNVNTTQPAQCLPLDDFLLTVGKANSSAVIGVGADTREGDVKANLAGDRYDDNQFIIVHLNSFDARTRRTTATFEFANRRSGTSGVVIGKGSFAMEP